MDFMLVNGVLIQGSITQFRCLTSKVRRSMPVESYFYLNLPFDFLATYDCNIKDKINCISFSCYILDITRVSSYIPPYVSSTEMAHAVNKVNDPYVYKNRYPHSHRHYSR